MLHPSQRDLVRASLASTHHPDCYAKRTNSRRAIDARPAAAGETCERAAVERAPESCDAPQGAGRDGRGASPTTCDVCGRERGEYVTDTLIGGRPAWSDVCPACAWDMECNRAGLRGPGLEDWIAGLEAPVLRAVPGTGCKRHV